MRVYHKRSEVKIKKHVRLTKKWAKLLEELLNSNYGAV